MSTTHVSGPPDRGDTRGAPPLSVIKPPAPPTSDEQIMGPPHCSRVGQCRVAPLEGAESEGRDMSGPLKPEVRMVV